MDETQRGVLRRLTFNWAPTADDVWKPARFHVTGLHEDAIQAVLGGFNEAREMDDSSPIGVVVLGQRGAGKTHLLGVVREQVQRDKGYFFLVNLYDTLAFWRSTVLSILDGLTREADAGRSQLHTFTTRLAERVRAPRNVRRAVAGDAMISRPVLDAFVDLLRKSDRQVAVDCQDTMRALVLRASDDPHAQDIGHTYLCSNDEEEPGERAEWGIRRGKRSAQEIVKDISRLLALTGPTLIGFDQIDLLIAQSVKSVTGASQEQWAQTLVIEQIAGGPMALREVTKRTVTVVTCLPAAWEEMRNRATDTVRDRFTSPVRVERVAVADFGRDLVEKRFQDRFARLGFAPPYPTWPILPAAFDSQAQFTPRELLILIDSHIKMCLNTGVVTDLAQLNGAESTPGAAAQPIVRTARIEQPAPPAQDLGSFDREFEELLDPNNDLAQLGDPWPEPPAAWGPGDAPRAADYLANTEVLVWTPRRENGRPLAFQPLPDFSSVIDDADEFAIAVDAAVGALTPRAKVDGSTNRAHLGRAVLQEAMRAYAKGGGRNLRGFIDLLANLPEGVSELENAEKLASDMSQTLYAATVIDPLFGGKGTPVDPGLLLTPSPDKRARVSVISLIGLEGDEQRQSFVNQLQLALFSWIKRHPAGDRPLGGLFVMDEAQNLAPSGALTACTQSTLALAAQARKYGLGLVFATQAPKGIHNRITGNAATQLYGLLTNPVQIGAARELARAAFLAGQPDDGVEDLVGPGLEQVGQVIVRRAHPHSVGGQRFGRKVGLVPGHDRLGAAGDGGGHVHPIVGVSARHLGDQVGVRGLGYLAVGEVFADRRCDRRG